MWLDNLKELKKKTGMSSKQIAEKTNMSERTISRIFSGDTDAPRMDTLRDIVYALGGSMDDLLAETDFRLPTPQIETLKKEIESLLSTIEEMSANEARLKAEITILKEKNAALVSENDVLRLKLEYEDRIIALHNYYIKRSYDNHEV